MRSAVSKTCALLTAVATATVLSIAGAAEAATPGQLDSGARLNPGTTLYSPRGTHALTMQTDGNLVLYAPGHVAIWSSGTAGRSGSILIEQTDGNLVVVAPGNVAVWWSGTSGRPGTVLQVQDDGNAVQYAPGHVAIWSTKVNAGTGKIAALATANEGRTACGTNTLGGRGYYTSCKPEAWCADFAKWVWANSGFKTDRLTAGAITFADYGTRFGTSHGRGYRPQVGDAIVYDIRGGSASHVGLVTSVGSGGIRTENGNWGGNGNPRASAVKPTVLPGNASIGYYSPSMNKTISAIVSPAR